MSQGPGRAPIRPLAAEARSSAVLPVVATLAASVAMGLLLGQLHFSVSLVLAALLGAVVLAHLISLGPSWCLAALVTGTIVGLYNRSVPAGPVDLRVTDVFYAGLLGWALLLRKRQGRCSFPLGQRQLGLFLGALAFSMAPELFVSTGHLRIVGWLRVVQTFSLVWLVPYAIERVDDLRFVLRVALGAACFEVTRATISGLVSGVPQDRLSGANGIDTTGLIAAVLFVAAAHGAVPRSKALRILAAVIGVVGLGLTQSVGSTVAAGVGLFYVKARSARRDPRGSPLANTLRFAVVGLVVLGGITIVRPNNLPGSDDFKTSTTAHRLILASAGIDLFLSHPLTGVGWQRSGDADVIGTAEMGNRLRARFGEGYNRQFFPDVQPASVHSAYVQTLAEAGLVGGVCLLAAGIALARGIRRVLLSARQQPEIYELVRIAAGLLVVVLVWWNTNPLFGAQPETVMACTLIGGIAGLRRCLQDTTARAGQEPMRSTPEFEPALGPDGQLPDARDGAVVVVAASTPEARSRHDELGPGEGRMPHEIPGGGL